MAQSFTAQIRNWTEKAKRNADLIVASAAQEVFFDMSQTQPSIKEIGSFELGKIPVDTGYLRNSLFATLNGSQAGQGTDAYVAALAGFEAGDSIMLAFSAEHAQHIEYGTQHFPGRFMVREAINGGGGWQGRIDRAAVQFGD